MKLLAVSFLAALVAAPLSAQAAQAPARYSVTLNGKVNGSYSYAHSTSTEECVASRLGWERRELVFRSVRPTGIQVLRVGNRADYRPSAVARVRESGTIGGRRWTETRRCRGAPIERTSGTCAPVTQRERLLRLRFRWAGANRIWFRPPAAQGLAVKLCGLDRAVPFRGWLDLAIGRVDEDALLAGRSLRVIARGEVTRSSTVVSEQDLSVGEELNVRWTLTFRRIR